MSSFYVYETQHDPNKVPSNVERNLRVFIEIETTEILGEQDLKVIEGMTNEEAEEFLSSEFSGAERYVRDELMLSDEDLVRIKIKLEDTE